MSSFRKILACIRKADLDFNLIEEGDRIALGLSGGKDSMVLMHALSIYQKFPHKNFEFIPIFLDLGFDGNDTEPLREYCKKNYFNLHIEDATDVYKILNQHRSKKGLLPCSICSRMKKAAINRVAHELNCNKVAFAHHGDDAIETLLMNELYGGRVATFSPKMFLSNTGLTFIRPLIYARESDITSLVKKENIPTFKNQCGNDKNTEREAIKKLTLDLYSSYDQAKDNFLYMLNNSASFDLWFLKQEHQIDKNGLYIRKISSQKDFFDVMKLRKENYLYDEEEKIYLIKKNDEVLATISFIQENNDFSIVTFVSTTEQIDKKILHYIENEIVIHTTPATIKINKSITKDLFGEEGYEIQNGVYTKKISKKNNAL
ncbi:MAG: tRNA 2-thiocytidine biosynthesis TtcA family protein [Bacilli bacterium]